MIVIARKDKEVELVERELTTRVVNSTVIIATLSHGCSINTETSCVHVAGKDFTVRLAGSLPI
jgi:hypothetical protein